MSDSPLAASAYETLGVSATASHAELRRAYRARLRQTHPDAGGVAAEFHAVQRAWELVGTSEARAAYDRDGMPSPSRAESRANWAPDSAPRRADSRPTARSHGHPGGWYREQYLHELREWVGRGVEVADPYDPVLLRGAPRNVRHLLAAAVAEEDTARELATLGIGFTVWHDVRTDARPSGSAVDRHDPQGGGGKLDHIVLGPTGLWALLSEDWGEGVKTKRGEIIGAALAPGERPVHELGLRARAFSRLARVSFSALVVVVPDGASAEGVEVMGRTRGAPTLLVQRPRLIDLLRQGVPGVGIGGTDLFEVRTRVQAAARFV
ncbi:MAG TPA: DnaJ domain-containing protein [Pseudolysinimonas sp.]|nr:DnaJ domain-containing protein [Pseudolysinimonas sp.]